MTTPSTPDPFSLPVCAGFLAHSIFASLQETLGDTYYDLLIEQLKRNGADVALPEDDPVTQFPLRKMGDVFAALQKIGGENGSRGLLQRSGRAWFVHLQRRSSPPLGIFSPDVLTLPKKMKVKRCGEVLAQYFQRYMGVEFSVEPSPDHLKWSFVLPSSAQARLMGSGLCDLWFGFWGELLYTLSGGKHHLLKQVVEASTAYHRWGILIPYLPFEG
ncbi:MAG: hypothetical protein Kow0088_18730 [Anaerolineales bacterium]